MPLSPQSSFRFFFFVLRLNLCSLTLLSQTDKQNPTNPKTPYVMQKCVESGTHVKGRDAWALGLSLDIA